MSQPFFSICIPNFNYGAYLPATIQSVLDQSFSDFEIIIQDNASTDNSWEVIQQFAAQDQRIKIFRNPVNMGFAPNLNQACRNASGLFYILLSSDDLMLDGALENYHRLLVQQPADQALILCSDARIVNSQTETTGLMYKPEGVHKVVHIVGENASNPQKGEEKLAGIHVLQHALYRFEVIGIFCATCFPAWMYHQVGGYDEVYQFGPDVGFLFRLLQLNPDYYWFHQPLFAYRIHQNNQASLLTQAVTLKYETDGYRTTQVFNEKLMSSLNLDRNTHLAGFVNRICLYNAIQAFAKGRRSQSLACYFFALSAYTGVTLRQKNFYLCTLIHLTYPISRFLFRLLYSKR